MSRLRAVWARLREALRQPPTGADPRIEMLARIVTAIATIWFTLAVGWEIGAYCGSGHFAAAASIGISGENILRWKILAPVLSYSFTEPKPSEFYCNHPWGTFWTMAVFVKVFGHHDFVCRLPAVLMSAATPPLLYAIGRLTWSPIAGAIAAASYVVLPIALAFGNFSTLEVPVIFGVLLATWGYLRMQRSWRRRWMLVSVAGFAQALNSDWAGWVFVAIILVWALPRGILFNGKWYRPVDRRRFTQWWALSGCLAAALGGFYVWQFSEAGQLVAFIQQGRARSSGNESPLAVVLESRAEWIELAFTPLAIFLGKLAAPLIALRLVLKRDLEIFPLAILAMALFQYLMFKQGADIHFFWPHYFAPYFALAMGALCGTIEGAARFVVRRFAERQGNLGPPLGAFAVAVMVPLVILPDGVRGFLYGRRTGGRFDEKGNLVHQDADKLAAVSWFRKRLEPHTSLTIHEGMKGTWNVEWTLRRPVRVGPIPAAPATGEGQYYMIDSRFILAGDLTKLVNGFHVTTAGPFWVADRARKGPIDGHRLHRREPGFFQWYFAYGVDPIYEVRPDAFVTWELRHHFGHQPNPPPTEAPRDLEQRRIAHNVAVSAGDLALAARLLGEIEGELDRRAARTYGDGSRLLGTKLEAGVAPLLHVLFLAGTPIESDAVFSITGTTESDPRWSQLTASTRMRTIGMPFELPTPLWKQGFIYCGSSEVRARPGGERFEGSWRVRTGLGAPSKLASPPVLLLRIPS